MFNIISVDILRISCVSFLASDGLSVDIVCFLHKGLIKLLSYAQFISNQITTHMHTTIFKNLSVKKWLYASSTGPINTTTFKYIGNTNIILSLRRI